MPADMILSDYIACPIVWRTTGFGITQQGEWLQTERGSVASQRFTPQISSLGDLEKIKMPVVSVDWVETEARLAALCEVFDGIMPVRKQGVKNYWYTPWDNLIRWWGVHEAMMDLVEKPDLVNAAVSRVVDAYMAELDQMEKMNLLTLNNDNTRIGSGGYGYTSELPGKDYDPLHVRPHNMWGCSNAQIFVTVSPEMHWEFAIRHDLRWLKRWGLTYYGCCEPLDTKLDILRRIPNLRKVSMSPWVDVERAVKGVGTDLVFSYKPSPAILAEDRWRPEQVRADLRAVLEKARGCHVEVILKDISTVRHEPQRLWEWAKIAMEVVEEFVP